MAKKNSEKSSLEDQKELDKANFVQRLNSAQATYFALINEALADDAPTKELDKASEHLVSARRLILAHHKL